MIAKSRYIYKLTFPKSGKIYIGQTSNLQSRLQAHLIQLRNGTHNNAAMQKDFDDFKEEEVSIDILENLGERSLCECTQVEWEWIIRTKSYLDNVGYNGNDPTIKSNRTNDYTTRTKDAISGISSNSEAIQEGLKMKPVRWNAREVMTKLKKVRAYLKEEEKILIRHCGDDDDVTLPETREMIELVDDVIRLID